MERHKCGLKPIASQHSLKFVGFIDAAFKGQLDEPTGLALRGLVACLQGGSDKNIEPMSVNGKANLVYFTVPDGLVDRCCYCKLHFIKYIVVLNNPQGK